MLNASQAKRIQRLLSEFGFDGWLLFDFRGINRVALAVLGNEIVGARRAFVLIRRRGAPISLVHAIDNELWRKWPRGFEKRVWVTREQLAAHLKELVAGKMIAIEYSPEGKVPYVDTVPAGIIDSLRRAGAKVGSSIDLVSRYCSVWTPDDLAGHKRAAEIVAAIGQEAIALAGRRARTKRPVTEFGLFQWIRSRFDQAGLVTESGPSVSYGANAARPHYEPTAEESAAIVPGKLLLVDLWAKEPGGIYADQTWMASIGAPSAHDQHIWDTIVAARDAALDLIVKRVSAGAPIRGAEADAAVRDVITAAGFAGQIESRTGHSIDRYGIHGFGPTIDDTETYDERLLFPGVGFSVEPGIYFSGKTGCRSEVNVHVSQGRVTITPWRYQRRLLVV